MNKEKIYGIKNKNKAIVCDSIDYIRFGSVSSVSANWISNHYFSKNNSYTKESSDSIYNYNNDKNASSEEGSENGIIFKECEVFSVIFD